MQDDAQATAPASPTEWHDRGVDAAAAGRYDDAAAAFQRAADLGERDALLGLGNARLELGDPAGAADAYRRAVESGDEMAVLNWGLALEDLEDWAGAERAYLRARDLGDPRAVRWLAELWRFHGERPELARSADDARDLLRDAVAAGDAEAAAALGSWLFSDLAGPSPEHEERLRDLPPGSEVERLLRRGAADDVDARSDLGWLLRCRGALEEAEPLLRSGWADGDTTSAIRLALLLQDDRRDLDGAESVLRALAEGGEPRAWNNLGLLLERRGRIVEARRMLSRGVRAGDPVAAKNLRTFLSRHHPAQVAEGTAPL